MSSLVWLTPTSVIQRLLKRGCEKPVFYFEFAPTGRAHAGLVRNVVRLQQTQCAAIKAGMKPSTLLGVGDRAAMRRVPRGDPRLELADCQLRDIRVPEGSTTYYDEFLRDVLKASSALGVEFDQVRRLGDLYESELLRSVYLTICDVQEGLLAKLSRHQATPPALYYPKCASCGRLYTSAVRKLEPEGGGVYTCAKCGYQSEFSVFTNNGTFSFKIEMALIWKWLEVDVQWVGEDHIEGMNAAKAVYELLFGACEVLLYVVNMVSGDGKSVAHKSRENFRPISEMSGPELVCLTEFFIRHPDRMELTIPRSLWPAKDHAVES
jgi:lysyl-tRNA synthetase class I